VLLPAYQAVYVDIAKNASSSVKRVLADTLHLDLSAVHGNPHEVVFPRPAAPVHATVPAFPGLFSFAFVRNPWDRLVSCYRDKIAGEPRPFTGLAASGVAHCLARFDAFHAGMGFDAFVEAVCAIPDTEADEHFRSQHSFLVGAAGELVVDFVGRVERLDADFRRVARQIGLPYHDRLPRLQSGVEPVDYRTRYDASTRARVARRFEQDIDRFGYTFM
jgi:hypothetical protein